MKVLTLGTEGTNTYTPITSSAGVADANKVIQTGSDGKLDTTFMPTGLGADTAQATAYENLSIGDLVNVYNVTGTLKARKADASGGRAKKAIGFVKESVTANNTATIYLDGTISGLTGLTIGADYYLSATAGTVTTTIPTTSNYIAQYVGIAKSATELIFEYTHPILID